MTTWKRAKRIAEQLDFRGFNVHDIVGLVGNPIYKGKIIEYVGYEITPQNKGRTYKVKWSQPQKTVSIHFFNELIKIQPRFKLAKRPNPTAAA